MRFTIIEDDRDTYGPYRVTTLAYEYLLRTRDGQDVVGYHWHPAGVSHETNPHIHLGSAQLADNAVISKRAHFPTGRVTMESVIRLAISQLGASPLTDKWNDRLVETEGPHILFRTWR